MEKGCNMICVISIWMSKTGILESRYVSYAFQTTILRQLVESETGIIRNIWGWKYWVGIALPTESSYKVKVVVYMSQK